MERRTEIQIVSLQPLKRVMESLFSTVLVWVIELGGQENLATVDTRGFNSCANFLLIGVGSCGVDMGVSVFQRILDSIFYCARLGLPGSFITVQ